MEHQSEHGPSVQVPGGGHRADTAVLPERGQPTGQLAPGRGGRLRDDGRAHDGQRSRGREDVQRGLDQGGEVPVQPARPEPGARVRRVRQRVPAVADHRVPRRARRPGHRSQDALHADVSIHTHQSLLGDDSQPPSPESFPRFS